MTTTKLDFVNDKTFSTEQEATHFLEGLAGEPNGGQYTIISGDGDQHPTVQLRLGVVPEGGIWGVIVVGKVTIRAARSKV